jgi:phosphoglycolate phosphatase-like HAD superfamily hydrolase
LKAVHQNNASVFPAIDGAMDLLRSLSGKGIPIAIATGDWQETVSFKLRAAGISFENIPMTTSSEFYSRADIIAGAVANAGRTLREAVYVGDGVWDLRACRKLGIPFVGVGHRIGKLRAAGATHFLPNLTSSEFLGVMEAIGRSQ